MAHRLADLYSVHTRKELHPEVENSAVFGLRPVARQPESARAAYRATQKTLSVPFSISARVDDLKSLRRKRDTRQSDRTLEMERKEDSPMRQKTVMRMKEPAIELSA